MDTCDFGNFLKIPCNETIYSRSFGMKNLNGLSTDEAKILLWREGLLDKSINNMKICLHHEKMFGTVFVRKQVKCCGILIEHKRQLKSQKTITLGMAELLRKKKINVIPGYKLCRNCLKEYKRYEQDDDQTEPENGREDAEFICVTPRKRLNTSLTAAGISPLNLHAVPSHSRRSSAEEKLSKVVKKFKHDISNAYDIDVDDLNVGCSEEFIYTDDNTQKAEELDKLYSSMKENLYQLLILKKSKSFLLFLSLGPEENVQSIMEYLVRVARDLK